MCKFITGLFAGIIVGAGGTVLFASQSPHVKRVIAQVASEKIEDLLFGEPKAPTVSPTETRTRYSPGRFSR